MLWRWSARTGIYRWAYGCSNPARANQRDTHSYYAATDIRVMPFGHQVTAEPPPTLNRFDQDLVHPLAEPHGQAICHLFLRRTRGVSRLRVGSPRECRHNVVADGMDKV